MTCRKAKATKDIILLGMPPPLLMQHLKRCPSVVQTLSFRQQ